MPQSLCVLGTGGGAFTFPYNAPQAQNPVVRTISSISTLLGRRFTDFGTSASRRDILLQFPTMDADFFAAINAKAIAGGTQPFVDENAVTWTVIVRPPTYNKVTPGGDGYIDVSITLNVVSSP